jgi:hypothetical protein
MYIWQNLDFFKFQHNPFNKSSPVLPNQKKKQCRKSPDSLTHPVQIRLQEHASMLRNTYIACLVIVCLDSRMLTKILLQESNSILLQLASLVKMTISFVFQEINLELSLVY